MPARHTRIRVSRFSALSQIALLNAMGGFLAALCFFLMLPVCATIVPEGEEESQRPLPSLILAQPSPDEGPIPEGMLPVSSITISGASGGYEGADGVYYQNLSGLPVDYESLLENIPSLGQPSDGAQVLILHTAPPTMTPTLRLTTKTTETTSLPSAIRWRRLWNVWG